VVAALVLKYYWLLRSVLRAKPLLRACLTRCRHCGIFFFTHPRNAGRHNLRCPFGCRGAHRQKQSAQRSAAYYRDPEGKRKKAALNQRRKKAPTAATSRPKPAGKVPAGQASGAPANPDILDYVRMVVSLIEGRPVGRRAIRQMLAQHLRQHTMVGRSRIDQAVAWLNEQPP
jgi:hypothetical protein